MQVKLQSSCMAEKLGSTPKLKLAHKQECHASEPPLSSTAVTQSFFRVATTALHLCAIVSAVGPMLGK